MREPYRGKVISRPVAGWVRIRQSMVSLHMARALETLDQTPSRLEKGEISEIEVSIGVEECPLIGVEKGL